ncbi:Ubiquitin-ligase [Hyphodiscus hymeniophilus]|uniref:Ubiquitin-ligase n=1 Tax=Hyphodiscus hymeniophilus TaxID=353542 RepID=A0A9P7AXL4_9HELO|nr:Ubiquitin-ligase [Hyphodiscus hymeniophilus]
MLPPPLSTLSVARKQHLLVEFSSLKCACPHGVFLTLTPGDPSLWSGPYAPAILRFQISFPPTYPSLPPLVTFSTDMFHPLITPLTTYMYTTDIQDSGTVSATDDERLPPGGFSLRDGFPGWFGRGARRSAEVRRGGSLLTPPRGSTDVSRISSPGSGRGSLSPTSGRGTVESFSGGTAGVAGLGGSGEKISVYEVLRYIRSAFDEEGVLDKVPLEAAGNPGAWHAWRAHRTKMGVLPLTPIIPESSKERGTSHDGMSEDEESNSSVGVPDGYQRLAGGTSAPSTARRPGEWNWEGVWEVRVKKGVDASVSEAVLFGSTAGDELVRFLNLEGEEVETIKENIRRSLESVEPQRRGVV